MTKIAKRSLQGRRNVDSFVLFETPGAEKIEGTIGSRVDLWMLSVYLLVT